MVEQPVPCNGCRACCLDFSVIPLKREAGDIPERYYRHDVQYRGQVIEALAWKENGECVYLGEHGCTIHEDAPHACRVFDCRRFYRQFNRRTRKRLVADKIVQPEVMERAKELIKAER